MKFWLYTEKIQLPLGLPRGESEGRVDVVTRLREEAKKCEHIAALERDQAKIDLLIAAEERRRQGIARRLQEEIMRLDRLRRA